MALSLIFFSTQLHEITRPPRSKEKIHSRDSWRAGISTSYSMSPDIAAPSLHSAATSSYEALGCHTRRSNKSIQSTRASTKRGQFSYLEAEATLRVNVPAIVKVFQLTLELFKSTVALIVEYSPFYFWTRGTFPESPFTTVTNYYKESCWNAWESAEHINVSCDCEQKRVHVQANIVNEGFSIGFGIVSIQK